MEELKVALFRFGKSLVETGIVFACAAVLAIIADADVTAREVAYAAAIAFVKGVIEASGRYLSAVKEAQA